MAVNNSLQSRSGGKPKFSVAIQTPMYQKLVNDTLGDPDRARRFVAAISSAVAVNPSLQECDAGTVLTAALFRRGAAAGHHRCSRAPRGAGDLRLVRLSGRGQ